MSILHKNHLPLVSIFVLTYNHKDFIDEFFKSIISQTYDNWEAVIGDDCSQDGTQERLLYYKELYPDKIKLILNKKNIGITANSQNVLKECNGKYICTIAGDDLLLPTKIEKQVKIMESDDDVNLVYHDLEVFYEDGTKSINFSKINSYTPKKGTIKDMILYGSFAGACSIMIRRDAIPSKGFDIRVPIASDWLFFVESVGTGKFVYIDEVLGKYRRHNANITTINNFKALEDHIVSCSILICEYPQYIKQIKKRLSVILFEIAISYMRIGDIEKFQWNMKASVTTNLNLKNITLFLFLKFGINDFNFIYKIKSKIKKSL